MNYLEIPTLENDHVRLEALSGDHCEDLAAAASVGNLSNTWYTSVPSPDRMAESIADRLSMHREGLVVPWAILDPQDGKAVGMTSFIHLDAANRRLEIGSTWLGVSAQGTRINPAAKLLLLSRAFEELGCIAVEFRTHWHNRQSRAAIERLGAKQDGVLRNHMVLENGTVRDTVVFSIIENEWPTVRFGLLQRLQART